MAQALLPPRLEAAARFVPAGARLLDVGTDHAFLPIALLQRGLVSRAVGADLRPGPLAQARANRAEAGLSERSLELRLGDGLAVVQPGEVDVAVLAGMGGLLMRRLLEAAPDVRQSLARLILAPNNHAAAVRRWAVHAGYAFIGEDLVEEGSHLYPVFALEAGPPMSEAASKGAANSDGAASFAGELSDMEAELGPLLLRQGHPLVPVLVRRLLIQARQALADLDLVARKPPAEGIRGRAVGRREVLAERVRRLEEVLACWPRWPT